jgi:hypothetical protein
MLQFSQDMCNYNWFPTRVAVFYFKKGKISGSTTRKTVISGAPVLDISGALVVRHYYQATANSYQWRTSGAPLLRRIAMAHLFEPSSAPL